MQEITWWLEFFYVDVKKDCNKSTHQNICEENNYRVDLFVPTMLRDEYIDKRKSAHIAKKIMILHYISMKNQLLEMKIGKNA